VLGLSDIFCLALLAPLALLRRALRGSTPSQQLQQDLESPKADDIQGDRADQRAGAEPANASVTF
jgi:hypothetical protein